MPTTDLKQLIQELRANENGIAQDRILLCGIYTQLKSRHDLQGNRFREILIKYTRPFQDALVRRFDHSQDYQISQSKRNLIHAWDALQCFNEFNLNKDSGDAALQMEKLKALDKLVVKGALDMVLNPEELTNIKTIISPYNNGHMELDDAHVQQVKSDFGKIIAFVTSLE